MATSRGSAKRRGTEVRQVDALPDATQIGICDSARLDAMRSDLSRLLAAHALVVEERLWRRHGKDQRFLRELAKEVLGYDADPYTFKIGPVTLADLLTQVNRYFYEGERTSGAAAFRSQLIEVQKGEFCVLCGARPPLELHVDHIVPTSVGGEHHIRNMQLLCAACNSAKSNWKSLGFGVLLQLPDSSGPSGLMRFRRLLEGSYLNNGRTFGRCSCGRNSSEAHLRVEKVRPSFAATYPNLQIRCDACS